MLVNRIFAVIFPIFAIVAAGYIYGRWKRPEMATVNTLNMDVLVPALLFHVLTSENFDIAQYQHLALGATAVILGSGVLALPVAWVARIRAKTLVPPMMFTNSGNMGLPLAVFAFGQSALPAAVVLLIVEMGLHFTLGTYFMDHHARVFKILKQPVVFATLAGLSFNFMGWYVPRTVDLPVEMLGQAAISLLLFSLGVRLTTADLRDWRVGVLGTVLCPVTGVAVVVLVRPWLTLTSLESSLLLVFGALPPAVLNFLLAERYHQEPGKVASIVTLGNLGAFVSIPVVLAFALT